jgi:hypothetical protein
MDQMGADLLLTGYRGDTFAALASVTLPRARQYAARHGMDVRVASLDGLRPASWQKLLALVDALDDGYERVLWLDADVVVSDMSRNVLDDVPTTAWQAMVVHETNCGSVPNCGVWVVTRAMRSYLADAWDLEQYTTHPWWEQAAVLELMGYVVTPDPTARLRHPTELFNRTRELGPEWNHHPHDRKRVSSPRFWHVTQYADRLATARAMVEQAEECR